VSRYLLVLVGAQLPFSSRNSYLLEETDLRKQWANCHSRWPCMSVFPGSMLRYQLKKKRQSCGVSCS